MTAKLFATKGSSVNPALVQGQPMSLTWGDLASLLKGRRPLEKKRRDGARSQQRP
ncbi:MAG: hypothetical protein ABR543_12855 [Gemmatimonadaceae bacterium]